VGKGNRRLNTVYPEENEGKVKDANRKLRSKIKELEKKVKKLQGENRQLKRCFGKSAEYINDKISDKNIEEVIKTVDDYEYKETKKGNKLLKEKKAICPKCDTPKGEEYKILDFISFLVHTCTKCGFRKRQEVVDEGNKGS
jgi:predicted nuclease with TOPRIM domain